MLKRINKLSPINRLIEVFNISSRTAHKHKNFTTQNTSEGKWPTVPRFGIKISRDVNKNHLSNTPRNRTTLQENLCPLTRAGTSDPRKSSQLLTVEGKKKTVPGKAFIKTAVRCPIVQKPSVLQV